MPELRSSIFLANWSISESLAAISATFSFYRPLHYFLN